MRKKRKEFRGFQKLIGFGSVKIGTRKFFKFVAIRVPENEVRSWIKMADFCADIQMSQLDILNLKYFGQLLYIFSLHKINMLKKNSSTNSFSIHIKKTSDYRTIETQKKHKRSLQNFFIFL